MAKSLKHHPFQLHFYIINYGCHSRNARNEAAPTLTLRHTQPQVHTEHYAAVTALPCDRCASELLHSDFSYVLCLCFVVSFFVGEAHVGEPVQVLFRRFLTVLRRSAAWGDEWHDKFVVGVKCPYSGTRTTLFFFYCESKKCL